MALNLTMTVNENFTADVELGEYNVQIKEIKDTVINNEDAIQLVFDVPAYGEQKQTFKTLGALQFQMKGILTQLGVKKATIAEFVKLISKQPTLKVRYTVQQLDDNSGKPFDYYSWDWNLGRKNTSTSDTSNEGLAL